MAQLLLCIALFAAVKKSDPSVGPNSSGAFVRYEDAALNEAIAGPSRISPRGARLIAGHADAMRRAASERMESAPATVVVALHKAIHNLWQIPYYQHVRNISCPVACIWSRRQADLESAVALARISWFSVPKRLPPFGGSPRYVGQLIVGVTQENHLRHGASETTCQGPRAASRFPCRAHDMLVSHELDSHVVIPYLGLHVPLLEFNASGKRRDSAVAAFISNCRSPKTTPPTISRIEALRRLAEFVPVHQYGSCGHNIEAVSARAGMHSSNASATKVALIASYRFAVAFENSCAPDYVTEKVYDLLYTGVVPIYMGAPNVADLLPCEPPDECVIMLERFVDAQGQFDAGRLAAHLQHLSHNDTALAQYHTWRSKPSSRRFLDLSSIFSLSPECRVCLCLRGSGHGCQHFPELIRAAAANRSSTKKRAILGEFG